ncbi:MAG: DUF4124 domain-containing protein [Betaproteobacteria bacterium]|nr:DUF4124 domain-containing protein [Betaproteobacteria bacterium]
MDARRTLIFVTFTACAGSAAAQNVTEIYKCQDASGRPLYTSDKRDTAGKKCELVSREVNVVPTQKPAAAGSKPGAGSGGPRESSAARASAKERQRDILEGELKNEEELLAKAKEDLAQQESVRNGDERNYARVLERLQPFKDNVELHEKNVEALRREISNLNR